ncbi:DNA internalization-related competence protein ComEC/Rec2 [Mariprofundus sp. KV]|uniref:DNA internalization-related competence protein ComEC/Rec2 n=1 Tax=Mariprofundus sp. KV TaxID=2608715 RepID=UPI0015A0DD85|nr:DNA internalization-related competence protein ComEC/Rec2 [Mariprofundus sp. KV]NWF37484.1 DNA internalization-related competence protein ComEC/Rec2 [Mariprofundus sp. KV]
MEGNVFDVRRLPLLWPVVVWAVGLALVRTDLLAPVAASVVLALFLLLLWVIRKRALAVVLLVAALWGSADLLMDARHVAVDQSWLSGTVHFSATVEKVERSGISTRLLLDAPVRSDGQSISGKVLLYSYGKGETMPVAGQRIEATARWRLPRNYKNPGAFDYKSWCFDNRVALIGSLRGEIEIIDANIPGLEAARQRIRAAIGSAEKNEQGVLSALLLAERYRVSEAASRAFSATGTAHLLAISGMHVGMAAAWMFALLWWLLTRRESWIVNLRIRSIALTGGFVAAFVYAMLAGWPVPAIRAAVMLAAAVLAWQLSTRHEPINILLAALGLILLVDPAAIASLSLWLSFVATAALLLWGLHSERETEVSWLIRFKKSLRLLLWSSLLAMLATLPMVVTTFGSLPVYGLPANLILVPLFGLFVLPAALLGELTALVGVESLAALLMQISGFIAGVGVKIITAISALPAGSLKTVVPQLWLSLLYGVGLTIAGVLWWQKKRVLSAVVVSLLLAAYLAALLHESDVNQPTWVVWDVGQGASSTLLMPGRQVMVIDVPGQAGSRFNGGTSVAEGLRAMGVTHVDRLVLSHAQSDHLGGALSLIDRLNDVGEIWLPDVPSAREQWLVRRIVAQGAIPIRWLARADRIESDGYAVEVLWPPRGFTPENRNNSSLVLRVTLAGSRSLLLPGDIELEVEAELLQGLKAVDLMLMPHHGSRSSSSPEFVQTLQPDLAIAQTGAGNRYGFPDLAVLSRYREVAAEIANTADGAVLVELSEQLQWQQWAAGRERRREMALRWWLSR